MDLINVDFCAAGQFQNSANPHTEVMKIAGLLNDWTNGIWFCHANSGSRGQWLNAAPSRIEAGKPVTLSGGELLRVREEMGFQLVTVRSGTIWITGNPSDGDIVLQAGDEYEFNESWPYVLQALGEGEVVFC